MYVSIDLVEEVIERQLRKYKNKIVDKQQESTNFQKAYLDKDYEEDEEVKIIRTKKFGIKPMYPYRWSFSDIISLYSLMLRQSRLT